MRRTLTSIPDTSVTRGRVQATLVTVAYIVTRHGPAYAPVMDRLEQELEAMDTRRQPVDRARAILEACTTVRPAGTPILAPTQAANRPKRLHDG